MEIIKDYFGRVINYSYGPYNKINSEEQWIRISEGCPNNCEYCYEPKELKLFKIPEIVRNNVKIMDMNLLSKSEALDIIRDLGERRVNNKVVHYELICGIDFRYLTPEIAEALKKARFINMKFAWDKSFSYQKVLKKAVQVLKKAVQVLKKAVQVLKKAGYSSNLLSCFVLGNHKISYEDCLKKLDLLKVWNVKVNDCWFDNQKSPDIIPIYWTKEQIKDFRAKCRFHNKIVTFGIDPEHKHIPAELKRVKTKTIFDFD